MKSIRKFSAAVLIAATLAVGIGTATLEAKKPGGGGGGGGQAAICEYLESVLAYPYLSEWIRTYVTALWVEYCS